jgi:hypothetical protein
MNWWKVGKTVNHAVVAIAFTMRREGRQEAENGNFL